MSGPARWHRDKRSSSGLLLAHLDQGAAEFIGFRLDALSGDQLLQPLRGYRLTSDAHAFEALSPAFRQTELALFPLA